MATEMARKGRQSCATRRAGVEGHNRGGTVRVALDLNRIGLLIACAALVACTTPAPSATGPSRATFAAEPASTASSDPTRQPPSPQSTTPLPVPTARPLGTLMPDVLGYQQADPSYGVTTGSVVYKGRWPQIVIEVVGWIYGPSPTTCNIPIFCQPPTLAQTMERFPVLQRNLTIAGQPMRAGWKDLSQPGRTDYNPYGIAFAYGPFVYLLTMGFNISSPLSARQQAAPNLDAFAAQFMESLRTIAPSPDAIATVASVGAVPPSSSAIAPALPVPSVAAAVPAPPLPTMPATTTAPITPAPPTAPPASTDRPAPAQTSFGTPAVTAPVQTSVPRTAAPTVTPPPTPSPAPPTRSPAPPTASTGGVSDMVGCLPSTGASQDFPIASPGSTQLNNAGPISVEFSGLFGSTKGTDFKQSLYLGTHELATATGSDILKYTAPAPGAYFVRVLRVSMGGQAGACIHLQVVYP